MASIALSIWAPPAAAQSHNITTVAGTGAPAYSGDGGPAAQAGVPTPVSVTPMPDGGYLIFEQGGGVVRRVLPDGTISTVAGNGTAGNSGDGGPATSASLNIPSGGAPTAAGGYLIADPNSNVIRAVSPGGTISTVAGGGGSGLGDGGPATSAMLAFPFDVVPQPDGGYLIADDDNHRIRRVDPSGIITTVAGGGGVLGDGGPATSAQLNKPSGVALTGDGGYLIADASNNRIRKVSFDGTITTVAGTGAQGFSGDGGPATAATLDHPARIAIEPGGGLLIADTGNQRIRRVAPDGTITTVAGTTVGFGGDGGPATDAMLRDPYGVAVLPTGDYLIADANNNRVRLVDADPPVPVLTGTDPASPSDDNTPTIKGSAPPGTTVGLFTNATCDGPSIAGGPAADLSGAGLPVTVADNSTTTFHAVAIDGSGNRSPCSPSSVTYVHEKKPPPPKSLPPPVQGKLANAKPEKGKVLVKVGNKGFVPLAKLGRQLPVGSTIDTTKGTVRLTTAKDKLGGKQFGLFSRGQFRFTQRTKNPLTTLSMVGAGLGSCSKLPRGGAPKVSAARKKRRRTLFSNVKGRFRTRGRNSAATVRGTSWAMTDTCAGTLTVVRSGSLQVRDFSLRKTKLVKAGHSYMARAPHRKKRRL